MTSTSSHRCDEVVALLERIAVAVESLARPPALPGTNDDTVAPLLQAIVTHAGARSFSTSELVIHAALPVAADLRAAILQAVGALNARRLGKQLKTIEGKPIARFM